MADIDLNVVLEANRLLLEDAQQRLAKMAEREAKLRAALDGCEAERREIAREKEAIELADRLYRRRFVPDDAAEDSGTGGAVLHESPQVRKSRARIGPQRYRILAHLREWGGAANLDNIADATGLTTKRIRDQFRSDLPDGIVAERGSGYAITLAGLELLERFERYKRAKGEPLPPLDGPAGDEDGEDSLPESDIEHEEFVPA